VARSETALSEAALSEAAAAIRLDRRNLRDLPPDAALEAALAAAR
jgi:hypothetical protein